jgi:hypothetical protein
MKLNLDAETAYIWWTYDDLDRVERARLHEQGMFSEHTLQADRIPDRGYAARPDHISFDKPENWNDDVIRFPVALRETDGIWKASGNGWQFVAVRASTPHADILTGRISQDRGESGPFIMVLPRVNND